MISYIEVGSNARLFAQSPSSNPRVCRVYPLIPRVNIKLERFHTRGNFHVRRPQSLSLSLSLFHELYYFPRSRLSGLTLINSSRERHGGIRIVRLARGSLVPFDWASSPFNQILIKRIARILDLVSLAIRSS